MFPGDGIIPFTVPGRIPSLSLYRHRNSSFDLDQIEDFLVLLPIEDQSIRQTEASNLNTMKQRNIRAYFMCSTASNMA